MANRIIIKNSSTASAEPLTTDLELGELAINSYDGKLFLKKNDGSDAILEIGGSSLNADLDVNDFSIISTGNGSVINIATPDAVTSGTGGNITMSTGAAAAGGGGGDFSLITGAGDTGFAAAGSPGSIILQTGHGGTGNHAGSDINLIAGDGGSGGNIGYGGDVVLWTGDGGESTSRGGNVSIYLGDSKGGTGVDGVVELLMVSGAVAKASPTIRFGEKNGSEYIGIKGPDEVTTSRTWVLPEDDPATVDGYLLTTNSTGVLSFVESVGLLTEDSDGNIFGGTNAGGNLTAASGLDNFLVGENAGSALTVGDWNVAIGTNANQHSTTARGNIAIGYNALIGSSGSPLTSGNGEYNTVLGAYAMSNTLDGADSNIALGTNTGTAITTGSRNVMVGRSAGTNITTGNNNICIGNSCGPFSASSTVSDKLYIDTEVTSTPLIGGDFSANTVTINGDFDVVGTIEATGGVDALTSATTVVSVAAATAPTANQVLTATSSTLATWQTPATVITDHGGLSGLGDDDHTQYLRSDTDDTGTNITLSTLTITGAQGFLWESGRSRITHNDGGGNCLIRLGHKYDGGLKFTAATSSACQIRQDIDSEANPLLISVSSDTGVADGDAVTLGKSLSIGHTDLTWDGDKIAIDGYAAQSNNATNTNFNGQATQTNTLTTNVSLTTSNRVAGRHVDVFYTASGANRTVTLNASWIKFGEASPITVPSGKKLIVTLVALGTTESTVQAVCVLQN